MESHFDIYGKPNISERQKAAWAEDMLKLMKAATMLQVTDVKIYDKQISLFKDLAYDEEGKCKCFYNYISDFLLNHVKIDKTKGEFSSGNLTAENFDYVIYAGYILGEFYNESPCFVHINGEVIDAEESIGWINHVLQRNYSNKRLDNLWLICEAVQKSDYCGKASSQMTKLKRFLHKYGMLFDYDIQILTSVLYVINGYNKTFQEHNVNVQEDVVNEASPLYVKISNLKFWLAEYQASKGSLPLIYQVLCSSKEEKVKMVGEYVHDEIIFNLLKLSQIINPAVYFKTIAEVYNKGFWATWWQYRSQIKDWVDIGFEVTKANTGVSPISTVQYLQYPKCFYKMLQDKKPAGEENTNVCDDDFIYYWQEDGEFKLSKALLLWFKELDTRLEAIVKTNKPELYPRGVFLKAMLELLEKANNKYHRIFAFEEMFYDFLEHETDSYYQAALKLLEELIDENALEEEKYDAGFQDNWYLLHPNYVLNPARRKIKRYLALLANKDLRQQVLGF